MKNIIKIAVALFLVCFIAVIALAVVEYVTRDTIKENEEQEIRNALSILIPECEYQDITKDNETLITNFNSELENGVIHQVYEALDSGRNVSGYIVVLDIQGYIDVIGLRVGILTDGKVAGVIIGENSETPGLGANISKPDFLTQFADKEAPFSIDGNIDKITSATYSSKYVVNGVNSACEFVSEMKGVRDGE